MSNINNVDNNIKKGSVLMKSALEKYEKGDFEGGNKDRELANNFFDTKMVPEKINFSQEDNTSLYGENRNFGIIYDVFKENVKTLLKERKNQQAIKDIINFIKTNKILKEQFDCYCAFKDKKISNNIDLYLNEAISFFPSFNKKEVIETNDKLIQKIREHGLDECINIDDDVIQLYEAIEFFMFNKKNLNNLDEYNTNKNVLKESIITEQEQNKERVTEGDYNKELKQIINKHQSILNEDEAALINEINENDKKEVFEKYKNETLKFISEQIQNCQDISEKIDWNNISTKISIKQFNEERILEDIISFINIKNIIEE